MSILGIIQAVFGAISKVFDWLGMSQLMQAGSNKERLRAAEQAQDNAKKAAQIDSQPDVTDVNELLKRLRKPTQGS